MTVALSNHLRIFQSITQFKAQLTQESQEVFNSRQYTNLAASCVESQECCFGRNQFSSLASLMQVWPCIV